VRQKKGEEEGEIVEEEGEIVKEEEIPRPMCSW
jgi:hypothetical protein